MVFTIPGEPRGKQRPRHNGKTGTTYTPSETSSYERAVAIAYRQAGGQIYTQPVQLEIWAFYKIPVKTSKKQAAKMQGAPCTKKPDADNVLKIIMDGLNGVAYEDDKQVVDATVHKRSWTDARVMVDISEA